MFFPAESLRRGGRFYLCWVADSWPLRFATITHRQLWSQDIRHICEDLLEVIKNESGRPANRFSLRLSSQLLRGVVRLYQKKVTVFIGEICMINAHVMKVTNKKWAHEEDEPVHAQRRPQLVPLIIEELPDEERVMERIENSGNVVANIQEITLKEPTLTQNQTLLDDGFGEMQMQEHAIDVMRAGDHVEQVSALSVVSVNETARSRLEITAIRPVMEGVSEHDISVFKKSMGESQLPAADFEKEIPDMPEIRPDLPAPVIDNSKSPEVEAAKQQELPQSENSSERRRREDEEFVLEELQDQPAPKRRRKNKLIIDKAIKLSSQFMASRIENLNVELRCESSVADVISTLVPASILLSRPAHAGYKVHSNLGFEHTRAFIRHCDFPEQPTADDREMEKALTARQRRASIRVSHKEARAPVVEEMPDLRQVQQELLPEVSNIPIDVDISFLPTQIVVTSPQKRPSALEQSPKRMRHSGYITYRLSKQLEAIAQDVNDKENVPLMCENNYPAVVDIDIDANDKENVPQNYQATEYLRDANNKENVPENCQAVVDNMGISKENVPDNRQNADQLIQMLQAEGLADVHQTSAAVERRRPSESSETPLGSLDRTKVSLGDSEKTTDSRRFIREEWGTQGTMHKIYAAVKARRARADNTTVRVETLVSSGPVLAGHQRIIVARCFTSILKLKQHGFIRVHKDPDTNEILDIELGSKITVRK